MRNGRLDYVSFEELFIVSEIVFISGRIYCLQLLFEMNAVMNFLMTEKFSLKYTRIKKNIYLYNREK